MAYSNLAQLRMLDHDLDGTLRWGNRAIALAEQLGETETLVHALTNVGSARHYAGDDQGAEELNRSLHLALDHGLLDHAIRALNNLAWMTMLVMRLDEAERRFATAIAYAIEHDLDTYHWFLLAGRATLRVRQGTWDAAELEIRRLLQQPMVSSVTRILALTPLGQVHARRGNPEAAVALDEALMLADRNGQLLRLGPVRAARAEAALLDGDQERAREEALAVRDLVFARGNRWHRGELAWLLWQAGDRDVPTDNLADRTLSRSPATSQGPLLPGTSSAAPTRRHAPWPRVTIPLWSAAGQRSSRSSGRSQLSDTPSVASARSASATRVRSGQNHGRQLAPVHTA